MSFDIEPDGDMHGECAEEINRLNIALKKANDQTEHFERKWYLRGDKIEVLEAKLTAEIEQAHAVAALASLMISNRDTWLAEAEAQLAAETKRADAAEADVRKLNQLVADLHDRFL